MRHASDAEDKNERGYDAVVQTENDIGKEFVWMGVLFADNVPGHGPLSPWLQGTDSASVGNMDTREARIAVESIATETIALVEQIARGRAASPAQRRRLQELLTESRDLLGDAGYPAEPVWRSLHRAVIGIDTMAEQENRGYWLDLAADLRQARETLGLLGHRVSRDSDIHVVG